MIAQRNSQGHMWPIAVTATDVPRKVSSDECPGDPARKRSLVNRSSGKVGMENEGVSRERVDNIFKIFSYEEK